MPAEGGLDLGGRMGQIFVIRREPVRSVGSITDWYTCVFYVKVPVSASNDSKLMVSKSIFTPCLFRVCVYAYVSACVYSLLAAAGGSRLSSSSFWWTSFRTRCPLKAAWILMAACSTSSKFSAGLSSAKSINTKSTVKQLLIAKFFLTKKF